MKAKDPVIKISDALEKVAGNQAQLARLLGIKRAWMCELVGRQHDLPPLLAHRFVTIYGRKSASEWVEV